MTRSWALRNAISSERSDANCLMIMMAALLVATFARVALADVAPNFIYVTYYPAVLICSILTGWRYGLVCSVLSGLIALTLFPGLGGGGSADAGSWGGFILFMGSSSVILATADALRSAIRDLDNVNRLAQTLNHELQHRVKNTLTVVQALASQSAKGANPEEFVATFNGRLHALAKAHELLGRRELTTCTLPDVIDEACKPFSTGANILKSGPACQLPPESCVPLVLALHELCTNAVKYGALSNSDGRVELAWSFDAASKRATIMWNEVGGPAVSKPTRKGLGTALLRRQAGILEVEHVFGHAGVSCKLVIDRVQPVEAHRLVVVATVHAQPSLT